MTIKQLCDYKKNDYVDNVDDEDNEDDEDDEDC